MIKDIIQLIFLIVIFVIILILTYYTTKYFGKTFLKSNGNIRIIDSYRISPSQSIQVVLIDKKYYVLALSKDRVEVIDILTEYMLSEEVNEL